MNFIVDMIYFVLLLGAIVFIHELGHFVCAKRFNVYCSEFALGMGPTIFKKQVGETVYALRLFPIGGFVQMAGEDGLEFDDIPYERTIKGIKPWKQVCVMLAGIVMNLVLAFVVFSGIHMAEGYVIELGKPVVYLVGENTPAEQSGLLVGDEITKITFHNGRVLEPENISDVLVEIQNYGDKEAIFEVKRNGKTKEISITPKWNDEVELYDIGIKVKGSRKEIAWYESFGYSLNDMVTNTKMIFKALGNLLQGIGIQNLSGPVGIFQVTAQTAEAGFTSFLRLVALFSLNVGIFNAIPLPALDGGRTVMVLFESLTGKKFSEKMETALIAGSMILLFGLMIFATFNDILKIFN